jgi:hypothetical protein
MQTCFFCKTPVDDFAAVSQEAFGAVIVGWRRKQGDSGGRRGDFVKEVDGWLNLFLGDVKN